MNPVDHQKRPPSGAPSLKRRLLLGTVAVTLSVFVALVTAEVLLRILPIPGIELQPFYYDETTGGKLYPGAKLTYRNARGELVERDINSWGFLDVEHSLEKAPGTLRIGFFGDSYTESRQVDIDDTFFRLIEEDINARGTNVETLAFGIAGRSTVQSWIECNNWMDRLDLDYVVYVFCENDPGDQLKAVSQADVAPFATLVDDSLVISYTFRETYRHKGSTPYRIAQYLKSNSLLVSTIVARLKLLRRHGVQLPPVGDGAGATGVTIMGPSSWPSDSLATYGWRITEHTIADWRDEVATSGRRFAVLRVPRAIELDKPLADQDAFAPRLHAFCDSAGIELIDPTALLREGRAAGREMYYDHFTPEGHRAVARAFHEWFESQQEIDKQWN